MSQILKILLQTRDINIFVFCGVSFSRYVKKKLFFRKKKTTAVKFETHKN